MTARIHKRTNTPLQIQLRETKGMSRFATQKHASIFSIIFDSMAPSLSRFVVRHVVLVRVSEISKFGRSASKTGWAFASLFAISFNDVETAHLWHCRHFRLFVALVGSVVGRPQLQSGCLAFWCCHHGLGALLRDWFAQNTFFWPLLSGSNLGTTGRIDMEKSYGTGAHLLDPSHTFVTLPVHIQLMPLPVWAVPGSRNTPMSRH